MSLCATFTKCRNLIKCRKTPGTFMRHLLGFHCIRSFDLHSLGYRTSDLYHFIDIYPLLLMEKSYNVVNKMSVMYHFISDQVSLNRHMSEHKPGRSHLRTVYKCPQCLVSFKSTSQLKKHQRQQHPQIAPGAGGKTCTI